MLGLLYFSFQESQIELSALTPLMTNLCGTVLLFLKCISRTMPHANIPLGGDNISMSYLHQ